MSLAVFGYLLPLHKDLVVNSRSRIGVIELALMTIFELGRI